MDKREVTDLSLEDDLDRGARIARCAQRHIDWVYEALENLGVDFWIDCNDSERARRVYHAVETLVAMAIINTYDATVEHEGEIWAYVLRPDPADKNLSPEI